MAEIVAHPELYDRWDWIGLSRSLNLAIADIAAHPEFWDRWYWKGLSRNPNFTMADIASHPELYDRWDWRMGLSYNKNFTIADIVAHPEFWDRWSWEGLSKNKNFTVADIASHPELYDRWDWIMLSYNKNITIADIVAHPEFWDRWCWDLLSLNPNFTMADIASHPELYDRWHWKYLSRNKYNSFDGSIDKTIEIFGWPDICKYHIIPQKFLRKALVKEFGYDKDTVYLLPYSDLCRLTEEMWTRRRDIGEELAEGIPIAQEMIIGQPGGRIFREAQQRFETAQGKKVDLDVVVNMQYARLYEMCDDPTSTRENIQHLADVMDLDIVLARLNPEERTKENYCRVLKNFIERVATRSPP